MARTETNVAAAQAGNLNSLANGAAKSIGIFDLIANNAQDATVLLSVTLAAAGVLATGKLDIYHIGTQDGVTWTDNIDPTSAADVSASLKNAKRLGGPLKADANGAIITSIIDIFVESGGAYSKIAVVVKNSTGAALPATGHAAAYQAVTYG